MNYYITPFKNILNFKGRASRKEFWYFFLINAIISTILILTKKLHGIDDIDIYYRRIYIIPFIALGFRRLHDTNKSGWLFLIPVANIILAIFEGDKNENKYGSPIID